MRISSSTPAYVTLRRSSMSASPLVDEVGDQSTPAGLVAGAQPLPSVAVVVLVKQDQVAPMGIVLHLRVFTRRRTAARGIARENRDHPLGKIPRELRGCDRATVACNLEFVAQGLPEPKQRMDQQIASRKPNGAAPVGIATLDLDFRLSRFIANRTAGKLKRKMLVIFGDTSQTIS